MGGRSPRTSGVHPGLPASHAHQHQGPDATGLVSETIAALFSDSKDKTAALGPGSDENNAKFQAKLLATSKERKVLEELYSNDGLAPGIFKFLWLWQGTGSDNQSVHIPQTVIFLNGTPVAWYFWSKKAKKVLRKQGSNIDTGKITEAFSTTTGEAPVVATYQQQEHFSHDSNSDVQQAPRALSQVQYLNQAELGALLAKGIRHRGVGVLQKFVVPADKRCTTVCATWSPQNCVVQRRTNKYRLLDSTQDVQRRLVTWDGPELLSETMPLSGTVITKRVETFCKEFVEHAFSASGGRYRIYRMSANFRVAADNSLHFLGATSLRLLDAGEEAGAMSLAISRAERGEREPPGPGPTTGVMTSTVRFDGSSSSRPSSAKNATAGSRPGSASGKLKYTQPLHIGGRLYSSDSLPSPGRLQGATAVGFAHSTDQFVCVVTGKVCHNKEGLYEVSYLKLIKFWEWEQRQKPAEERAAEQQVPAYIQRAQPAISAHWYLSARNNPKWTARMATVCAQAATAINNALQGLRPSSSGDDTIRHASHQAFRSSASQLAQPEALAAAAAAGSPPGSASSAAMGHWRRPASGSIGSWRPGSAHLAASASEMGSAGQSGCFALPAGSSAVLSRPHSGSSTVSKTLAPAVPVQAAAAAASEAAEMAAASDVAGEQQEAAPQQQGDSPGGAEQATDDAGAAAGAADGPIIDGAEQQVLLQETLVKEGELQQDVAADAAASSTQAAADDAQGISPDAAGPDHAVIKESSASMQQVSAASAAAGDAPEVASGGHAPEASAEGAPGDDAQAVPCAPGDVAAGACDTQAEGMQQMTELPASEEASGAREAAGAEGAAAEADAPEPAAAKARPAASAVKKAPASAVTKQHQQQQKRQVGHRMLAGHSRKAEAPAAKQQQPEAAPEPPRLTMKEHIKQTCAVYGVQSSKPAGKKVKSKQAL